MTNDVSHPPPKTLFIIRHAHAVKSAVQQDLLTPLTEQGRRCGEAIAEHIARYSVRTNADTRHWTMLFSPAQRTQQTAEYIQRRLPAVEARKTDELYRAHPGAITDLLLATPPAITTVIVVGHNPSVSGLAQELFSSPQIYLDRGEIIAGALADWASLGGAKLIGCYKTADH